MDFDLTEEQLDVQKLCREFAEEEIAPHAAEWDAKAEFPLATVQKMGELGLLGLPFPEQYGGSGADTVSYALAVMEIGRADASVGITMAAHVSLGSTPFSLFGTEAQKEKFLVPLARGDKLWAFGLTEPQAGSDLAQVVQRQSACPPRQWGDAREGVQNGGEDRIHEYHRQQERGGGQAEQCEAHLRMMPDRTGSSRALHHPVPSGRQRRIEARRGDLRCVLRLPAYRAGLGQIFDGHGRHLLLMRKSKQESGAHWLRDQP